MGFWSGDATMHAVYCGDIAALVVASAIFDCLLYLRPELETHQLILVSDYLDGASFISVAATSLVATFMICYQIYSRTTPGSGARRLYRHIVDALVQSSCVYTVTVILLAIVDFLVNSPNFRVNADILEAYSSALGFTITGLAPTLMIARLATGSTHYGAETASSTSFTSAINGEPCDSYRSDSGNPQSTHKEATQTTKHTRGEGDQLEGDEIMVLTRHTEEPGSVSEGSSV
ncbi:hypothetical protein D9613_005221 [Agrocybe pediades]|uniref:Uncharacterized protein n=1 Tax=Agrocybe pediades TaxID=84607 RepID=A0A8H4R1E7_9AGAR|nr:hypothetical protein D9613_005221 [Agrocybe pediades]